MIVTLTRLISFLSGKAAAIPIPQFLRGPVFTAYGRIYGANLGETERKLVGYRSLSDFFSRALISGARPIATPICSPADGRISGFGEVTNHELIQAKGKNYTIGELLLDGSLGAEFSGGSYFTVYLAPGDYHRVHSPVTGQLKSVRHIPGALYPVSNSMANRRERLFSRNERVCLLIETKEFGKVILVFIGALNVGSIALNYLDLKTNQRILETFSLPPLAVHLVDESIKIGEELGKFNLGSTVVILTEQPIQFSVEIGDKVQMGQKVTILDKIAS